MNAFLCICFYHNKTSIGTLCDTYYLFLASDIASQCISLCTLDLECMSVLYNGDRSRCMMFNDTQTIYQTSQRTDTFYAEKINCNVSTCTSEPVQVWGFHNIFCLTLCMLKDFIQPSCRGCIKRHVRLQLQRTDE